MNLTSIRTFLRRARLSAPWTLKIFGIVMALMTFSVLAGVGLNFLASQLGFWAPPVVIVAIIFVAIFVIVYTEIKKRDQH